MEGEKKLVVSSTVSPQTEQPVPQHGDSDDQEVCEVDDTPSTEKATTSMKEEFLLQLFGADHDRKEVVYVVFAALLIAFNCGFINGVTMTAFVSPNDNNGDDEKDQYQVENRDKQMIAGFAGAYTENAQALYKSIILGDKSGETYRYLLWIILSYMLGAFIAAMICPRAEPYVIEPKYGPTFLIGGGLLLAASLLALNDKPSRYVFYLATASNGVQNGIASIYSKNLIRCTLTGACTDIAIVIAQCINKNYTGLARGAVLGGIVFFFWIGSLVSCYFVENFKEKSFLFNAALFFMVGVILVFYLVKEVGISLRDAVLGTWQWREVLKKLDVEEGDELTREKLMKIFDDIDVDGNDQIDSMELKGDLKRKARLSMSQQEIRILIRAADEDGDGVIDRKEWGRLCEKIVNK